MIVSKQKIIETYLVVYALHQNDVKRLAEVHKITGANMDYIVQAVEEYQSEAA